jgi:hypothetical protein
MGKMGWEEGASRARWRRTRMKYVVVDKGDKCGATFFRSEVDILWHVCPYAPQKYHILGAYDQCATECQLQTQVLGPTQYSMMHMDICATETSHFCGL